MAPIVLLVGVLLLLYGLASLTGGQVAASRRLREHSRAYAAACLAGGVLFVAAGLALLLS